MTMNWKSLLSGFLAVALVSQPILTQAVVIQLPKEVKVNYPKEFKEKIEDIKVCLSEAESKIYNTVAIDEGEADSDHSTEPLEIETNCESMVEKYELNELDQMFLDKYEGSDSPYIKETRELRIAMVLFIRLNQDMHGEIAEKQTPDDMIDQALYRIFNLLYELPKAQGHPMIIDFVREVRDSFLNVIRSEYFKSVVYFFYHQNPDKELNTDLLRFVYHLEQAEDSVVDYVPDEDMVVEVPQGPEITLPDSELPELNPDEQAKEDLDAAWEQELEKIEEEEEKENPPTLIVNDEPRIERIVYISYEVKNDVCMKVTETYMNNKSQGKRWEKAPAAEAYNCGRLEDLVWDDEGVELQEDVQTNQPMIYYQYGKEDKKWPTNILLDTPVLEYETLVQVLRLIADEQGVGSLGGEDRYLFAIGGLPLVLNSYENTKSLEKINQWLISKKMPIQLIVEIPEKTSEETE